MELKHDAQLVESILQQRRTREAEVQAALGGRVDGLHAIESLMQSCDYVRCRDEYVVSYGWDNLLVQIERNGVEWQEPHDPECYPRRYANKLFCFLWVTRFWAPAAEQVKAFMSIAELKRIPCPTEIHELSKDTFLPVLNLAERTQESLWPTIERVAALRWGLGRKRSGLERFQALLAAHIYESDPDHYEYELFERKLRTCFGNLGHLDFELAELETDVGTEVPAAGGKEARTGRRRSKRIGYGPVRFAWESEAIVLLQEHPEWNDRRMAKEVGISPSRLCRSPVYKSARTMMTASPRRGFVHGAEDLRVDGIVEDNAAEHSTQRDSAVTPDE